MESAYKVTPELAYICGSWSSELPDLFREHHPERVELVGDWSDLSPFEGIVDSVESLRIAGTIESGKIESIRNISVFRRLKRLDLASKVKAGFDVGGLPHLEEVDVSWQPEVLELLALPTMRAATMKAFSGEDLSCLPRNNVMSRIWLVSPAVETLVGLGSFSQLSELRISDARKLRTLQGVEGCGLSSINIENARKLTDLGAVTSLQGLERLILVSIASDADVSRLAGLSNLRVLQVGGKGVPVIDWIAAMSLPHVEKVFAWWDPAVVSESQIREALRPGRQISKFDPVVKRGKTPLFVEIKDA